MEEEGGRNRGKASEDPDVDEGRREVKEEEEEAEGPHIFAS